MKRSPLCRKTPLRRTPMKRGKPSGRARPDVPLAEWCQAAWEGCYGRASHRHHLLPRSAGGGDEAANTKDLCAACHAAVHANPARAYEAGLLRRRTA